MLINVTLNRILETFLHMCYVMSSFNESPFNVTIKESLNPYISPCFISGGFKTEML